MSVAPKPEPRPPPSQSATRGPLLPMMPPARRASRSYVLATAWLRALHLDPLLTRRRPSSYRDSAKATQTPLASSSVFIERVRWHGESATRLSGEHP
jgi:hypothetical protein